MRRTALSGRFCLSASVLALLAAAPASAWAQTGQRQAPPGSPESSVQDDDPAQSPQSDSDTSATAAEVAGPLETGTGQNTIVVTGSRIARPEISSPSPVQSFTSEAIEQSGDIN